MNPCATCKHSEHSEAMHYREQPYPAPTRVLETAR